MERYQINKRLISENRSMFFALACTMLLLFFLLGPYNYYLYGNLYNSAWYQLGVPIMFALYLAFRGFRGGAEMNILVLYIFWAAISRVLLGDIFLNADRDYVVDLSTMVLLFAPGILLDYEKREKLFLWTSLIFVLLYLLLGALCVYLAVTRSSYINPIDGHGVFGYLDDEVRISLIGLNPNVTAGHFVIAIGLSIVLLFQVRFIPFKILMVVSIIVDFVTVTLTVSRNGQTCVSAAIGLMAGIAVISKMKKTSRWIKVPLLIVLAGIIAVGLYQLHEPIRYQLHEAIHARKNTIIQTAAQGTEQTGILDAEVNEDVRYKPDVRKYYYTSGRKPLYLSALQSLKMEPRRILLGSTYDHVMDISHQLVTKAQMKHFHNTFLEVVNEYGVPGLLLVISFFLLIFWRAFQIVFDNTGVFKLWEKMMVISPLLLMFYFMLECGIFAIIDMAEIRGAFFFFICGMVAGTAKKLRIRQPETEKTAENSFQALDQ